MDRELVKNEGGITVAEMLHGLYWLGQSIVAQMRSRRGVPLKDALIDGMHFECNCTVLIHHRKVRMRGSGEVGQKFTQHDVPRCRIFHARPATG